MIVSIPTTVFSWRTLLSAGLRSDGEGPAIASLDAAVSAGPSACAVKRSLQCLHTRVVLSFAARETRARMSNRKSDILSQDLVMLREVEWLVVEVRAVLVEHAEGVKYVMERLL